MRVTTIVVCVVFVLALASCGRAETPGANQAAVVATPAVTLALTATASPTAAAVPTMTTIPTAASAPTTAITPTAALRATQPAMPTRQETIMPTNTPPNPSPESQRPAQPTSPPSDLQATPLVPDAPAAPAPAGSTAQPARDPALDRLAQGARADLAQRQGIDISAVEIVEVRSVVWPDRSLGCPQPGVEYPQVQVDGIFISLRAGGQVFNYHGGGGKAPFLCEQKQPGDAPIPAPPPGSSDT